MLCTVIYLYKWQNVFPAVLNKTPKIPNKIGSRGIGRLSEVQSRVVRGRAGCVLKLRSASYVESVLILLKNHRERRRSAGLSVGRIQVK
jgi:hypothetical protein